MLLNNPRQFWNAVHLTDSLQIVLTNLNGEPIDDEECPSMLNNVFSSAFLGVSSAVLPLFSNCEYLPMDVVLINDNGIAKIIDSLKPFSSAGVDCITPMLLKTPNDIPLSPSLNFSAIARL